MLSKILILKILEITKMEYSIIKIDKIKFDFVNLTTPTFFPSLLSSYFWILPLFPSPPSRNSADPFPKVTVLLPPIFSSAEFSPFSVLLSVFFGWGGAVISTNTSDLRGGGKKSKWIKRMYEHLRMKSMCIHMRNSVSMFIFMCMWYKYIHICVLLKNIQQSVCALAEIVGRWVIYIHICKASNAFFYFCSYKHLYI